MIPTGTDAPLYYRPYVTVGLIVANVVAFVLAGASSTATGWDGFYLAYGEGWQPVQWLTYNFVHFGAGHLIGNMIFLWVFGMVVEGKVGPRNFLLLYLGCGVLGGLVIQTCMLGYAGGAVGAGGASLVIFGLISICILWAPENEVSMVWIIYFHVVQFEVRIFVLGLIYLAFEVLGFMMSSARMGSESGHLIGMVIGAGIGYWMLKTDRVDCEGWDLLTITGGGKPRATFVSSVQGSPNLQARSDRKPQLRQQATIESPNDIQQQFVAALTTQALPAAAVAYRRFNRHAPVPDASLRRHEEQLCRLLMRQEKHKEATQSLSLFVSRYPANSDRQRLCLATLLIQHQDRPKAALRAIEPLDREALSDKHRSLVRKLERKAARMIEAGVLEVAS